MVRKSLALDKEKRQNEKESRFTFVPVQNLLFQHNLLRSLFFATCVAMLHLCCMFCIYTCVHLGLYSPLYSVSLFILPVQLSFEIFNRPSGQKSKSSNFVVALPRQGLVRLVAKTRQCFQLCKPSRLCSKFRVLCCKRNHRPYLYKQDGCVPKTLYVQKEAVGHIQPENRFADLYSRKQFTLLSAVSICIKILESACQFL